MPEKQEKPLVTQGGVTHHCYNADDSMIAVSPNSEVVIIYDTKKSLDPTTWEEKFKLTEHAQFVTGIDWCAKTNKIVTCSHDRNAYVWDFKEEEKEWKPTLVVLRISRAATDVKWSPDGTQFAVTSGAKCVPICHYDESQDWWIASMIKKHKSTVLCVDWSPDSKLVVTGACDYKARILSANIDKEVGDDAFGLKSLFPKYDEFGEQLAVFDEASAWVNGVAWSADGNWVSFVGHGATMHFVDIKNGLKVSTFLVNTLPFSHVGFTGPNQVVAVSYDSNMTQYDLADGTWKEAEKRLDPETVDAGSTKKVNTARSAAFAKFQAADTKGAAFGEEQEEKTIKTFHKNVIVGVKYSAGKITTSGYDGRILEWKL